MEDVNSQNVTKLMEEMKTKTTLDPPQDKSSSQLTTDQPSNQRTSPTLDKAVEYELKHGRKLNPAMDRKKFRRTISNRLSAKRARMRTVQYIDEMEKKVNDLEETISVLNGKLKSSKEKWEFLLRENDLLKKLIGFRSNESKLHEMELEQKQLQINNLKELQKAMANMNINNDQFVMQSHLYLEFDQNGFHHLNKYGYENPVCAFVQPRLEIKPNFRLGKKQEGDNIDQYLNYEALDVYPRNG